VFRWIIGTAFPFVANGSIILIIASTDIVAPFWQERVVISKNEHYPSLSFSKLPIDVIYGCGQYTSYDCRSEKAIIGGRAHFEPEVRQ
jgi:hypothetical protein